NKWTTNPIKCYSCESTWKGPDSKDTNNCDRPFNPNGIVTVTTTKGKKNACSIIQRHAQFGDIAIPGQPLDTRNSIIRNATNSGCESGNFHTWGIVQESWTVYCCFTDYCNDDSLLKQ
ncbi:unnamed protein product, partial [Didymodactylos carnosus]